MDTPQVSLMFDTLRVAARYEAVMRGLLRDEPVSLVGYGILSLLRTGAAETPSSIADAFGMPRSSITAPLRALEEGGLIEREPDAEDGRSHRVRLTVDGRATQGRVTRAALQHLGPAEATGLDVPRLRSDLAALSDHLRDRATPRP